MTILVIELCDFVSYPTGGQLAFVRNMMKAFDGELALVGYSTDDTPVGEWTQRTIDGRTYDYFAVSKKDITSKKPLIPNRITGFFALKRHMKSILRHKYDSIFIQAPEVLFSLPDNVLKKVAIDLPGLSNPLENSRYPVPAHLSRLYEHAFVRRLKKTGAIWATADKSETDRFISRSGGIITQDMVTPLPTRYDEEIFNVKDKADCRRNLNIDENALVIVTVGRLNVHKGWQLMLESLKSLLGSHENILWAMIGDGEDEMAIRQFIGDNKLDSHVLLTGRLSPQIIAEWLCAADLFVMGSEKEGWSTALVEACACGVPCVTTDFSSAGEMIEDGVNGYVVSSRAPADMAAAIEKAILLDRDEVIRFDRRYSEFAVGKLKSKMMEVFSRIACMAALIISLLMLVNASAFSKAIKIHNQEDFNSLQQLIDKAAEDGAGQVKVIFDKGEYFFRNNHVKIYGKEWADLDLTFVGNSCTIIPECELLRNGNICHGNLTTDFSILDDEYKFQDIWGESYFSESKVSIVDEKTGECKLKASFARDLKPSECKDSYILLTEWYWSKRYKINRIDKGYIYFIADDLSRISPLEFNVNYDWSYGHKFPRFKLFGVGSYGDSVSFSGHTINLKDGLDHIFLCKATTFLDIVNSQVKSVTLSGIRFSGGASVRDGALINTYKMSCNSALISDCTFHGVTGTVINSEYSDNFVINGNVFDNCPKRCISLSATCNNIRIKGNKFNRCGTGLGAYVCVTVCGDNYLISDNTFCDFGYGGIFTGCTTTQRQGKDPSGKITGNKLFMTGSFLDNVGKYTMMDSGAIYLSTCHGKTSIQGNYIHDIGGIADNRGIFCDDGARNLEIRDNVVLNILNSYSIDSRRVAAFEKDAGPANVNNIIEGNLVNAPIRFEGNESGDNCILGENFILKNNDGSFAAIKTKNISKENKQAKIQSLSRTKWEATVK